MTFSDCIANWHELAFSGGGVMSWYIMYCEWRPFDLNLPVSNFAVCLNLIPGRMRNAVVGRHFVSVERDLYTMIGISGLSELRL